jgi:hypothetical protein
LTKMDEKLVRSLVEKATSKEGLTEETDLAILDSFLNELTKIAKKDHLSNSPNVARRRNNIKSKVEELIKLI